MTNEPPGPGVDETFERAAALHRAGRVGEAEELYREALRAQPDHTPSSYNLGVLLLRSARAEEAISFLAAAFRQDPARPQNRASYAEALLVIARGQLRTAPAGAASHFEQILELGEAPMVRAELGLALFLQGRLADAERVLRAALEAYPDQPAAWNNLANILVRLDRFEEAEACYHKALELAPDPGALRNLGTLLFDVGRPEEGRAAFRASAAAQPGLPATLHAHLGFSPIAASREDIDAQRDAYARGLDALADEAGACAYGGEAMPLPWFGLAYHGLDDRPLMEATAKTVARLVPNIAYESHWAARWRGPASARVRVGFVSDHFSDHTIGRLYRRYVQALDRAQFEVVVVHGAHSRADAFRSEFDAGAERVMSLSGPHEQRIRDLAALECDVIFYPDIGMSASTWFLAHARLAPVQVTAWGHPDTTGIANLDYFISADRFEPEGGASHYSEHLVRTARIPVCLAPPEPFRRSPGRAALGLPVTGAIYACPQTLFKIHPDFDDVLAEIARGDPTGWIVMPAADKSPWSSALRARWDRSHPDLGARVRFTPRAAAADFLTLLDEVDVLLDPIHFGSGYTFYLAMGVGTPMVTWAGDFARGRVVAGAYAQMSAPGAPVAPSLADYTTLALELGRDPGRRLGLRQDLREAARAELFDDVAAIREFETFLLAAVEAASRGARLPRGWRPS